MYDVLVGVHAACGLLGLVVLPVPLVARKGGRAHRTGGWLFVAAMAGVSFSGLVITALWAAIPLVIKPLGEGVDPQAQAAALREMAVFLGFLAWLILGALWAGLRVVSIRRGTVPPDHPLDRGMAGLTLVGGALLILGGLWLVKPLYIGFGLIGIVTGRQDLSAIRDTRATAYRHGRAMGGAAIAAVTAFLVFNTRRFVELPDAWTLVPWVLPSLVGSPLLSVALRPYRPRT